MPATTAENEPIAAAAADKAALTRLRELMTRGDACDLRLVSADGEAVELPAPVLHILRQIVEALARDRIVQVTSMNRNLTLHEAAELLNVRVNAVEQLIGEGQLPCAVIHHRRTIPYDALMKYKAEADARGHAVLDELTQLSQEFGLYDLPE